MNDQLDRPQRMRSQPERAQSSIGKSVEILFLLADGETRFSRIAKLMGFGNGTTHRLLKNLVDAGMVAQDPITKDYFLSSDILRLSARVESSFMQIGLAAMPEMEALRDQTQETICLCKRVGLRKVIVEEITSRHGIKFEYGKGYSSAFHSGATGAALLSHLREPDLEMLIDKAPLIAETPQTVTERNAILARVSAVQRDGYAISFGEVTAGTASISIPLRDGSGCFALTVVGPSSRFFPKNVADEAAAAARRIEARLGR